MDSGSQVGTDKLSPPSAALKSAPFSQLESGFLELLSTDVEAATRLLHWLTHGFRPEDDEQAARRDRLIGRYYEVKSNHTQAVHWTNRALEAFRQLNHRQGVFQCLRTLFSAYMYSGRYDHARACAEAVLNDPGCSESEKLKVNVNLGSLEHRLHRHHQALRHFEAALGMLKDDPSTRAIVLYNRANVLVCINEFNEADDCYLEALTLFREAGGSVYEAYILQARGYLSSILGQFYNAETQIKGARTIYLERGDDVGAALCDYELFHLNVRLNKTEAALSEIEEVVARFETLELAYEMGLTYFHGVTAALAQGDVPLAESFLETAIDIFAKEDNHHYLAMCRMLRGMVCLSENDEDEAAEHMEAARTVFVHHKQRELELRCLVHLTRIHGRLLSDTDYRRIRFLLGGPIGHQARTEALLLVSDYWYQKRQLKRAVESRLEAVMTIEEARASIIDRDRRESFFGDKLAAYEPLIEWLFHWRNPRAPGLIFKLLELSRARQFAERLSELEQLPPVLNQEEPGFQEMSRLKTRLSQLDRKLNDLTPDADQSERATLLQSYETTLADLDRINARMRDEDRLGHFFPIDFKPEEILKHLPPRHLVVSYFIGSGHVYRVELDHKGLKNFAIPTQSGFKGDLNLLFRMLSNRYSEKEPRIRELIERLCPVLWPKKLAGNDHIVFIPHKDLQTFPFAMLSRNGRLLLESHTMNLCPNLPTLYFCLKKAAGTLQRPVFFFSESPEDPAAPERAILTQLYPAARVHTRVEAGWSEETLASDFIHFAGHCFFNPKRPLTSYLEMGGRRMLLNHLKDVRLASPFINLASCQSGSMVTLAGNEPAGFVTAFFASGATNILAGLWDLDDEATGAWMTHFYRNLDQGLAKAYQAACLNLRRTSPEPWHWAAFCLFGRP